MEHYVKKIFSLPSGTLKLHSDFIYTIHMLNYFPAGEIACSGGENKHDIMETQSQVHWNIVCI